MAIQKVTTLNFEEFIDTDAPVLLDFYADWCGPCRMLAPELEALGEENPTLKIGKINVDENGALAARFGISSIPFVALLRGGELVASSLGYMKKEQLAAKLGL